MLHPLSRKHLYKNERLLALATFVHPSNHATGLISETCISVTVLLVHTYHPGIPPIVFVSFAMGINRSCRHAIGNIKIVRNYLLDRFTTCKGINSKLAGTFLPFFPDADARTEVNGAITSVIEKLSVFNYTIVETTCKGLFSHIDTHQ